MGMLDKLRKVGNYVRKGWRSTASDSYFQYRRGRERQRKQEERGQEYADRSAGLEREEVQRGREHEAVCGRTRSRRAPGGGASR